MPQKNTEGIVLVPRRVALDPVTLSFRIGPASPERAAMLARKIGLLRAELKLQKIVFVKPHLRRWPGQAAIVRRSS